MLPWKRCDLGGNIWTNIINIHVIMEISIFSVPRKQMFYLPSRLVNQSGSLWKRVSLHSPDWWQTCDHPASAFQVLGLQYRHGTSFVSKFSVGKLNVMHFLNWSILMIQCNLWRILTPAKHCAASKHLAPAFHMLHKESEEQCEGHCEKTTPP